MRDKACARFCLVLVLLAGCGQIDPAHDRLPVDSEPLVVVKPDYVATGSGKPTVFADAGSHLAEVPLRSRVRVLDDTLNPESDHARRVKIMLLAGEYRGQEALIDRENLQLGD